jgi:hypothetical protein
MNKIKFTFNVPISVIGFLFLAMKLSGKVDWGWFWILSPFILGFIMMGFTILMVVLTGRVINSPKFKALAEKQKTENK